MMRFNYREVALDSYLINLSGPLNIGRSRDVVQMFRDLSEQGIKRVVVNLEGVPFIDSHGLAALLAGYNMFGSDPRNFRLTGIQDQPRLVLELTGFDRVFRTDVYLTSGRPDVVALSVPAYVFPQFVLANTVV